MIILMRTCCIDIEFGSDVLLQCFLCFFLSLWLFVFLQTLFFFFYLCSPHCTPCTDRAIIFVWWTIDKHNLEDNWNKSKWNFLINISTRNVVLPSVNERSEKYAIVMQGIVRREFQDLTWEKQIYTWISLAIVFPSTAQNLLLCVKGYSCRMISIPGFCKQRRTSVVRVFHSSAAMLNFQSEGEMRTPLNFTILFSLLHRSFIQFRWSPISPRPFVSENVLHLQSNGQSRNPFWCKGSINVKH